MTKRDIAILALRLMSIYVLMHTIVRFVGLLFVAQQVSKNAIELEIDGMTFGMIIMTVLPVILLSVLAAILWFASEKLADRITRGMSTDIPFPDLNTSSVTSIAFSVVGIIIIASALGELLVAIGSYVTYMKFPSPAQTRYIFSMISEAIKLSIGLWLLFGSKSIARFTSKIRNFAVTPPPEK